MPLRLHVDAAEAVHAEGVLDAVDVLAGGEEADHVAAAQDQRLAVPPALGHAATLTQLALLPVRRPNLSKASDSRTGASFFP